MTKAHRKSGSRCLPVELPVRKLRVRQEGIMQDIPGGCFHDRHMEVIRAYRSSNHMWLLRAMLFLIGELPGFALGRRARKGTGHLRTEEGSESIKPIHLRRPAFPKDPHDLLVALREGSD